MDRTRFQLTDDIWLDARRAVWLPKERVLAVADLHLGYAWAARHSGQLLPLGDPVTEVDRLTELQREYRPKVVAVLGDIVHRAISLPQLETELRGLVSLLRDDCRLVLIQGNHDRRLELLIQQWGLPVELLTHFTAGAAHFLHGDATDLVACRQFLKDPGTRVLMGHEHPAVAVGDGVASVLKCPCFLVSDTVIILPAFSTWCAGTVFPRYPFMSALAQSARFTQTVAILGEKLLPLAFGSREGLRRREDTELKRGSAV